MDIGWCYGMAHGKVEKRVANAGRRMTVSIRVFGGGRRIDSGKAEFNSSDYELNSGKGKARKKVAVRLCELRRWGEGGECEKMPPWFDAGQRVVTRK